MSDRGLIAVMVAGGLAKEDAEDMVSRVSEALLAQLHAGRSVSIDGVGRLRPKLRRRRIVAPGPDRGKAIEERVVNLLWPAILSAGQPYETA